MPILAASRLMFIVVVVVAAAAIDFAKIYDGYCIVFSGISAVFRLFLTWLFAVICQTS